MHLGGYLGHSSRFTVGSQRSRSGSSWAHHTVRGEQGCMHSSAQLTSSTCTAQDPLLRERVYPQLKWVCPHQ